MEEFTFHADFKLTVIEPLA